MIGRRAALVAALGLTVPTAANAAEALPSGTMPKEAVRYRDHPRGQKSCARCAHFLKPQPLGGEGRCAVVAGPVAPTGYCIVWQDANPPNTC